VVYWTHHAQRVDENPALDVACEIAAALDRPLLVYHGLSSEYRYASDRHHVFQLQSAKDLQQAYEKLGIRYAFFLQRRSDNTPALVDLAKQTDLLITEDFPGEPTDRWLRRLSHLKHLTILAVDTACVVPMQLVGKPFDRAFAFRDATKKLYKERVSRPWPASGAHRAYYAGALPFIPLDPSQVDPLEIVSQCDIDPTVPPVADTCGGSIAGYRRWEDFLKRRLSRYASKRNDPCSDVSSRMSAYLHYGMVSAMRLAREAHERQAEKYLEELLIWRELAYGYCFYNSDYSKVATLPVWVLETLRKHQSDRRVRLYSWETLARAQTDDPLWNACQESLIKHGELHNNVRMTWGKALLQWTESPEQALAWLIDLNHRYALDGRDPASYGGILWCLGQFDRPFYPEQPILGTVRPRPTAEHTNRLDLGKYQVHVNRPIASRPCKVAVVGAGLAGSICARTLSDTGIHVEVFEKSRGASGRSATRRMDSGNLIDHGAPFLELPSQRWALRLESWERDSVISRWEPRGAIWNGHEPSWPIAPVSLGTTRLWVGQGGMNRLGKYLSQGLNVHYRTTVDSIQREDRGWILRGTSSHDAGIESRIEAGPYDAVVFAIPAPQAAALVTTEIQWHSALAQKHMRATWALLVEFEQPWQIPFDAVAFNEHPCLDWICRESSKPGRSNSDAWCVHANDRWSRDHLECNPPWVAKALLDALRELRVASVPSPIGHQVHRWRYALRDGQTAEDPNQHTTAAYLWDPVRQCGACGDWVRPRATNPNANNSSATGGFLGRPLGLSDSLESGAAMAGAILRHWIGRFPVGEFDSGGKTAYQPSLFGDEPF
jgi:photolyase PhrII